MSSSRSSRASASKDGGDGVAGRGVVLGSGARAEASLADGAGDAGRRAMDALAGGSAGSQPAKPRRRASQVFIRIPRILPVGTLYRRPNLSSMKWPSRQDRTL